MDRKTLIVVAVCVLTLVGWQTLINKIYPPTPKKPVALGAPATNAVSTPVTAANEPLAEKPAAVAESSTLRPSEQTATLANAYISVEFTSWGGGVRKVDLLQHKDNGHGHVVLGCGTNTPALSLVGVAGADTNAVFTIEQPDSRTIVMKASDGATKSFSLTNDYVISSRMASISTSRNCRPCFLKLPHYGKMMLSPPLALPLPQSVLQVLTDLGTQSKGCSPLFQPIYSGFHLM